MGSVAEGGRRLRLVGAVAGSLWLVEPALAASSPGAPVTASPFSVDAADRQLAKLPAGDPWEQRPDGSTLAWGESHLLHALVNLYEATGEVRYLEEAARRGDRLLSHRDDRRGVVDGSGQSRPAWSMADKYVVAAATLVDEAGRPALQVRSVPTSHNNFTEIAVVADSTPGRFDLHVTNEHFRRSEVFTGLTAAAGGPRFVEASVNARTYVRGTKAGKYSDESRLIRVAVAAGGGAPRPQRVRLTPIPLAYTGYLGVIYHPMLRLAECVRADARAAALADAAARFVQAAEESYADADRRVWRDGPGDGEGYYLTCERGESFPYDNIGQPFNFLGRHTATLLALHRLTGEVRYRERAARMARLFQRRLRHDSDRDLYVWNYWYEPVTTTGWTAADGPSVNLPQMAPVATVEDVSHGVLDIVLVSSAHRAGMVFDDRDLQRFCRTLLQRVLTPERNGIHLRVDGTGGVAPDYLHALGGWLELARYDPAVYHEIRRTAEAAKVTDLGVVTALLKWERVLAGGR